MILRWKKASLTKIQGIFIFPGEDNAIPKEKEEAFRNDAFVQEKIAIGLIELRDETPKKTVKPHPRLNGVVAADETPKEKNKAAKAPETKPAQSEVNNNDGETDDISEMNVGDACDVIDQVEDVAQLEQMLETEDRKTVKKAIKKRIKELA